MPKAGKGFETTFRLEPSLYGAETGFKVAGKASYKLDWFFVKADIFNPDREGQSYRFAPHLARTMSAVNYALSSPISDHPPMSIDLPFEEPGDLPPPRWPEQPPGAEAPDSWDYGGYTCGNFVEADDPTRRGRIVWSHGYYSGLRGARFDRQVTTDRVLEFYRVLLERCSSEPHRNYLGTVAVLAATSTADTAEDHSEAEKHWDMSSMTGGQLRAWLEALEEDSDVVLVWLYGNYAGLNPSVVNKPITEARVLEFAEQMLRTAGGQSDRPILEVVRDFKLNQ